MEKEIKINEVYTLTVGDLDGMLNDFLSDLRVDEDAITGNQVEQLATKLIDRFLFESDPSKWPLKGNSLPKTLQIFRDADVKRCQPIQYKPQSRV